MRMERAVTRCRITNQSHGEQRGDNGPCPYSVGEGAGATGRIARALDVMRLAVRAFAIRHASEWLNAADGDAPPAAADRLLRTTVRPRA
jgi:hypothetical protein